jgi:hypothetical protein
VYLEPGTRVPRAGVLEYLEPGTRVLEQSWLKSGLRRAEELKLIASDWSPIGQSGPTRAFDPSALRVTAIDGHVLRMLGIGHSGSTPKHSSVVDCPSVQRTLDPMVRPPRPLGGRLSAIPRDALRLCRASGVRRAVRSTARRLRSRRATPADSSPRVLMGRLVDCCRLCSARSAPMGHRGTVRLCRADGLQPPPPDRHRLPIVQIASDNVPPTGRREPPVEGQSSVSDEWAAGCDPADGHSSASHGWVVGDDRGDGARVRPANRQLGTIMPTAI